MKKWYCLALSIFLLITPMMTTAQTDDPDLETLLADFETFESEDGMVTLMHPTGWIVNEDEPGALTIGSNEEVITRLDDPEGNPEEGDLAISLIFFPTEFIGLLGISGENVADYATTFGIYLMGETTGNEADAFEVDTAEVVQLREDLEIGVLPFRSEKAEGRVIIYEMTPEIVVWLVVAGYPDDVDASEDSVYALVSSIQYNGTIDDLMASFE